MYVVFWLRTMRRPNLEFMPKAHCDKCGCNVDAVQTWKNGRKAGKYRKQYVYCCPVCGKDVEPYYFCALNIIDFSLPMERIRDRARPLRPKTMERIRAGLKLFENQAIVVSHYSPGWARSLDCEIGTVTTRDHHSLVTPFMVETGFSHSPQPRTTSALDAARTQTGRQSSALVMNSPAAPFLVNLRNHTDAQSVIDPTMTVCAGGIHHGVIATMLDYHAHGRMKGLEHPVATLTTKHRAALVCSPFVFGFYNRPSGKMVAASGMNDPLPTIPAIPVHAIVAQEMTKIDAEDCYFRMFHPKEIKAAQVFDDGYVITGNKREQVKQIGAAVPPPTMKMISERLAEIL